MLARLRQYSAAPYWTQHPVPGVFLCALLAAVASAMATVAGSAVAWGLLLGLGAASLAPPARAFLPGIGFAGKHLMRTGVALLGFQISAATLQVLDSTTIVMLAVNVVIILSIGWALGALLGLNRNLSLVSAAAVAICGASAAAAFAIVLLRDDADKRDVACTIGAVSILSSIALLVYPPLLAVLGLDAGNGGILLGGTIHEVAHAVAAGYSVDPATGEVATVAKLLRVAMLAPAALLVSMLPVRGAAPSAAGKAAVPLPPAFLIAFVAFAALTIAGAVPPAAAAVAAPLSRFLLVMAVAAIGLTLPWRAIQSFGWRPLVLLLLLSLLLLATVTAFVMLHR